MLILITILYRIQKSYRPIEFADLILTHHKLPLYPKWKETVGALPSFKIINTWLDSNFEAVWNSHNCKDADQKSRVGPNWEIAKNLPYSSMHWRSKACLIAAEAKAKLKFKHKGIDWINEQLFTTHISRLCLMLADHYYSSREK